MNNIYIIIFDKIHLHEQFFSSKELAENFLMEEQNFKHFYGDIYCNEKHSAQIKELNKNVEGEKTEWWYLS